MPHACEAAHLRLSQIAELLASERPCSKSLLRSSSSGLSYSGNLWDGRKYWGGNVPRSSSTALGVGVVSSPYWPKEEDEFLTL